LSEFEVNVDWSITIGLFEFRDENFEHVSGHVHGKDTEEIIGNFELDEANINEGVNERVNSELVNSDLDSFIVGFEKSHLFSWLGSRGSHSIDGESTIGKDVQVVNSNFRSFGLRKIDIELIDGLSDLKTFFEIEVVKYGRNNKIDGKICNGVDPKVDSSLSNKSSEPVEDEADKVLHDSTSDFDV
jgi:hypothetical protein